jgi:hypothetical protein
MRRLLFLGLGGALLVTLGGAGSARADNGPHVENALGVGFNQIAGTDRCASCHRENTAHTAIPPAAGRSGLCLTCHGPAAAGATTDVVDGVGFGVGETQNADRSTKPGALRAGGFENALIGSGEASKETYLSGSSVLARNQVIPVLAAGRVTTSKHGVTGATATAWDRSSLNPETVVKVTLECGSCHDPHGNGSYRILRPYPGGSGPSAVGVTIPDAGVRVYTTTNYWLSGDASVPAIVNGVTGGTAVPDGYSGNIARWCATCHTGNHFDTTIKMTGTTCVTCHVAHGSNASMSEASSSPVTNSDGSAAPWRGSLLRVDSSRVICIMCHNR